MAGRGNDEMIRNVLMKLICLQVLFSGCASESDLLKHNYVRPNHGLSDIDTLVLSRVYTNYYDKLIWGYRRDSLSEDETWTQVPIKMKRKLDEYGIVLKADCDSSESVQRHLPNVRIVRYQPKDERIERYLRIFEERKRKEGLGCGCGAKHIAVVFHFGAERTKANRVINNSYLFPVSVLTLGLFRIRWREGYSQMGLIIYDCENEHVVYNGINSRCLVPSDTITVNKHLEVILAEYKKKTGKMKETSTGLENASESGDFSDYRE